MFRSLNYVQTVEDLQTFSCLSSLKIFLKKVGEIWKR